VVGGETSLSIVCHTYTSCVLYCVVSDLVLCCSVVGVVCSVVSCVVVDSSRDVKREEEEFKT
jgi:hypothetical protein